jgi:hypothetical protein
LAHLALGKEGEEWGLDNDRERDRKQRANDEQVGPADYYPKYEPKYFRFALKPKYVKIRLVSDQNIPNYSVVSVSYDLCPTRWFSVGHADRCVVGQPLVVGR